MTTKVNSYLCQIVGDISNTDKCKGCNCLLEGPEITNAEEIKYLERNNGHIKCNGPYTTLQFLKDTGRGIRLSGRDLKILANHGYNLSETRFRDLPESVREMILSKE